MGWRSLFGMTEKSSAHQKIETDESWGISSESPDDPDTDFFDDDPDIDDLELDSPDYGSQFDELDDMDDLTLHTFDMDGTDSDAETPPDGDDDDTVDSVSDSSGDEYPDSNPYSTPDGQLDPYRYVRAVSRKDRDNYHSCVSANYKQSDSTNNLDDQLSHLIHNLKTLKDQLPYIRHNTLNNTDVGALKADISYLTDLVGGFNSARSSFTCSPLIPVIQAQRDYFEYQARKAKYDYDALYSKVSYPFNDAHIGRTAHNTLYHALENYDKRIREIIENDPSYNEPLNALLPHCNGQERCALRVLQDNNLTTIKSVSLMNYHDLCEIPNISSGRARYIASILEKTHYFHRIIPGTAVAIQESEIAGVSSVPYSTTNDLNSDPEYQWLIPSILCPRKTRCQFSFLGTLTAWLDQSFYYTKIRILPFSNS